MSQEADIDTTFVMQAAAGRPNPADSRLNVRFYSEPVLDEQMSDKGYHQDENGQPIRCNCVDDDGRPSSRIKAAKIASGEHLPGGRPIYRDVTKVRVIIPGDRDNIVDQAAWISPNPGDVNAANNRFPKEYQAFLQKKPTPIFGTPLSVLTHTDPPILRMSQVKELEHFNVRTAEQLIGIPDSIAQKFFAYQTMKKATEEYLKEQDKRAPINALNSAVEEQRKENEYLRQTIKDMGDRIESLTRGATNVASAPNPVNSPAEPKKPGRKPKKAEAETAA